MKKFLIKILAFLAIFCIAVVGTNIVVDPANLFHDFLGDMSQNLSDGKVVILNGDIDERLFQKERIKYISNGEYDTVILGSSHIMYIPWDKKIYSAGVSGATLYDYIALVGILDSDGIGIKNIVIGIDPWIFAEAETDTRYKSIEEYAEYEEAIINGADTNQVKTLAERTNIDKVKELFSPSYFQASIRTLLTGAVVFGVSGDRYSVTDSWEIDDNRKILPNGVRLPQSSNIHSAEEIEQEAKSMIEGGMYQEVDNMPNLSKEKMRLFEDFVESLKNRGINVTFYLPAWHPIYYDYFTSQTPKSGVLKVEEYIVEYAEEQDIDLRGSYSPEISDVKESDFMDSLHLLPEAAKKSYGIKRGDR